MYNLLILLYNIKVVINNKNLKRIGGIKMTNLTTYINKIEALRDSYRELKNNATDNHKQKK